MYTVSLDGSIEIVVLSMPHVAYENKITRWSFSRLLCCYSVAWLVDEVLSCR